MIENVNDIYLNKITVITVSYNAERSIEQTIRSVIDQTYYNFEYIIIDGNSSDNTLNIIKRYDKSKNYRWLSEPDNGIFDAMNKGLDMATGDWIIFMNAGDCFVNSQILQSVFHRQYAPDIGVVYGQVYLDRIVERRLSNWTPFMDNSAKIREMGISHQAMFVRSQLAKEYKFDETFKIAADYNMINNIYEKGYLIYDLNVPIAIYDTHGYSAQNRILKFKEVARICKRETGLNFKIRLICLRSRLFIKKFLKQN